MIIDFHVHLGKSSQGSVYSIEDLITNMKRWGIEKLGLSLLNGVDTRLLNNVVYECAQKYPNEIVPFAYINPREPFAVEEVHRTLGELKFKGIKFHSWKCGYYPDNNLNLSNVITASESYGVPILTHTGTPPLSLPSQWAWVAKRHPQSTFVFAHMGYLDYGYGCIEAVKELPNCYVDSSGQVEIQILEKALKELGEDRIIFATDWPYKYPGSEICKFDVLNLTEEQKRKIFYENAKKLMKV